jgi:hypothetical protein
MLETGIFKCGCYNLGHHRGCTGLYSPSAVCFQRGKSSAGVGHAFSFLAHLSMLPDEALRGQTLLTGMQCCRRRGSSLSSREDISLLDSGPPLNWCACNALHSGTTAKCCRQFNQRLSTYKCALGCAVRRLFAQITTATVETTHLAPSRIACDVVGSDSAWITSGNWMRSVRTSEKRKPISTAFRN